MLVAARPFQGGSAGRGHLVNGNQLARQQGLVDQKSICLGDDGVGGDPIAFEQHDRIAAHDLAAGDTSSLTIPDHKGARAGDVAQGVEHAFAARFLDDGDRYGDRGEGKQHCRLGHVAEDEIDRSGTQQQGEHRFAQHLADDAQQGSAVRRRQVVEAIRPEALLRLFLVRPAGTDISQAAMASPSRAPRWQTGPARQ